MLQSIWGDSPVELTRVVEKLSISLPMRDRLMPLAGGNSQLCDMKVWVQEGGIREG